MVVSHLLKDSVANKTVDARDKDALPVFGLGHLDRGPSRSRVFGLGWHFA